MKNYYQNINADDLPKLLSLIELCEEFSSKYNIPDSLGVAVRGLKRGLEKYYDRVITRDDDIKDVEAYLTWYIKTALEYESGVINEDTKSWKWD